MGDNPWGWGRKECDATEDTDTYTHRCGKEKKKGLIMNLKGYS